MDAKVAFTCCGHSMGYKIKDRTLQAVSFALLRSRAGVITLSTGSDGCFDNFISA